MDNIFDKTIKNQQDNFNNFIKKINSEDVYYLIDTLIYHKFENIYIIGVGKSQSIASYISDIFKSIKLKSFNINSNNLTHGDLGCICKSDLVIFISKSGNTKELLDIVNIIPCNKILLTCNNNSYLQQIVSKTLIIPFIEEADIHFNIIPSNSSTNILMFINFVINVYIEKSNLELNEYKINHPSGDIGFKTKQIKDFINKQITICTDFNLNNDEIIELLLSSKNGIIFENNKGFHGILTTKDVLKFLINKPNEYSIYDLINTKPVILDNPNELIINKLELLQKYKIFKFIPILCNNKCIGILDNSLILRYI